jgi:hypothetical protein
MKFKERPKGPNNFLKIESGQTIKGILRGELFDYEQHWSMNRGEPCKGPSCLLCEEGHKKTFRFRANILINEGGIYTCKIFEQGGPVYDFLKGLSEEYDLEKTVLKITRTGEKLQTKYSIMPVPGVVDDAKFKDIPLHDLTKFEKSETEENAEADSIPF